MNFINYIKRYLFLRKYKEFKYLVNLINKEPGIKLKSIKVLTDKELKDYLLPNKGYNDPIILNSLAILQIKYLDFNYLTSTIYTQRSISTDGSKKTLVELADLGAIYEFISIDLISYTLDDLYRHNAIKDLVSEFNWLVVKPKNYIRELIENIELKNIDIESTIDANEKHNGELVIPHNDKYFLLKIERV